MKAKITLTTATSNGTKMFEAYIKLRTAPTVKRRPSIVAVVRMFFFMFPAKSKRTIPGKPRTIYNGTWPKFELGKKFVKEGKLLVIFENECFNQTIVGLKLLLAV